MSSTPTDRDLVWHHALRLIATDGSFDFHTLEAELGGKVGREDIRKTLETIVELGWLTATETPSPEWKAGEQLQEASSAESSVTSPGTPDVTYPAEQIETCQVQGVSTAGHLIVKTPAREFLATHGPIGESISVPQTNTEIGLRPVQVSSPRSYQHPRALDESLLLPQRR